LYLSPRDAHQQKTEKSISDIRIFEELYKFLSATYHQGSKETTHASLSIKVTAGKEIESRLFNTHRLW
jgi:hypothetical protein